MKMPMPPPDKPPTTTPQANNHGFNLFGKHALVLSHIPMFMPPHQAQLFLEVTLEGNSGQNPTQIYLDDQAKTQTTDYVLVSDPMVLQNLAPHAPNRLHSFTGKLYRGWPFNNPNTAPVLVDHLTVKVKRSIYYHGITDGHVLTELTYLAFHTSETDYLAHVLVQPPDLQQAPKPPDFYQVLAGKIEGGNGSHLDPAAEVRFPGVANDIAHKLNANESVKGLLHGHEMQVRTHAELIYDPNHLT